MMIDLEWIEKLERDIARLNRVANEARLWLHDAGRCAGAPECGACCEEG